MSKVTITTGLQRAARLIPFNAGNLRGDYAAVLSPIATLPVQLRMGQGDRTAEYMTSGARNMPPTAPRYYVTSYGTLIAWVTLDGRTHFADDLANGTDHSATRLRHQARIRASWPERFAMDTQGDPTYSYGPNGWQPIANA